MQFTDKVEKLLVAAQNLAREFSHVQLDPSHIAVAMFDDPDGTPLIKSIIVKAGGDPAAAERGFKKLFVRLPTQEPAPMEISLSPQTAKLFREADQQIRTKATRTSLSTISSWPSPRIQSAWASSLRLALPKR